MLRANRRAGATGRSKQLGLAQKVRASRARTCFRPTEATASPAFWFRRILQTRARGTDRRRSQFPPRTFLRTKELNMGRYLLLWLLGVPLPILALIWVFGGLH